MNAARRELWVSALLRWFDRHREPMPWRSAPTPYRVWISEMREKLGVEIEPLETIATVRHAFSHFGIVLRALRCRLVAGRPLLRAHEAVRWVRPAQLADFPMPAADRRIARLLARDPSVSSA